MASTVTVSRGLYANLEDALGGRHWYESDSARQTALGMVGVAAFFGAWWIVVVLGIWDQRFLPTPFDVVRTFVDLVMDGSILTALRVTLLRVVIGFAIGTGAGLVVGFGMATSRYVYAAFYPIFAATFPLPKIALLPLSIAYLGLGEAPIIAVVAISAFYLLPVNVMAAVGSIDPIYRDVASDLGVSRRLFRRTVSVPYALPMISAAMRSAWVISLIVVIAAEILIGDAGLGHVIWKSGQVLEIETMFSAFLTIGILGYGSHVLFDWLTGLLVPWQKK